LQPPRRALLDGGQGYQPPRIADFDGKRRVIHDLDSSFNDGEEQSMVYMRLI